MAASIDATEFSESDSEIEAVVWAHLVETVNDWEKDLVGSEKPNGDITKNNVHVFVC